METMVPDKRPTVINTTKKNTNVSARLHENTGSHLTLFTSDNMRFDLRAIFWSVHEIKESNGFINLKDHSHQGR